ncbi:MAG TPA: DUF983 domain-containing protein [Acidimicrobiales bacterium]|nr:DUF983 domain-containing protein [Acidimicrobiales bacterium]
MDEPQPKPVGVVRMLVRGLLRRCPLCGSSGGFDSFFSVKDRCPRCNFPFKREEGHWIGALGMNTVVTLGLLMMTMVVAFIITWEQRRALPIFVACFLVAGLTPILFFGSSQTLWSAIDLAMRPLEPEDEVDPRWIPPAGPRGPGW